VGTALLIAGGVFAAVKLTQHDGPAGTAASSTATAPNAGRAPNTGPFTGIYTAKFGPTTLLDPDPALDPGLRPSGGYLRRPLGVPPHGVRGDGVKTGRRRLLRVDD
jgi:serine/threonine-protein kinase